MALLAARPARFAAAAAPARRGLATPRVARPVASHARSVVVRAEAEDFDAVLNKYAEKWEKADNKPVLIGYAAAAAAALWIGEWFAHLPALDVLVGFPIQLVGFFTLPYLGVRWFVDGKDAGKDIEEAVTYVASKLPGLEKK